MTKDSKAQIEVWKWKARLSEELNRIPECERIDWIKKKTAATIAKLKMKKVKRTAALK